MNESKKYTYGGEKTDVQWDGRLCIHHGECGAASGDLFVGGRQPWCQPDLSSDEEIRDVLLRCPSGALTATFADGSGIEADVEENHTAITQNVPLYLSGKLKKPPCVVVVRQKTNHFATAVMSRLVSRAIDHSLFSTFPATFRRRRPQRQGALDRQ